VLNKLFNQTGRKSTSTLIIKILPVEKSIPQQKVNSKLNYQPKAQSRVPQR